jgi:hypothetical protein
MVAKNSAQKQGRPAPAQRSKVTTYHLDLEPSDVDHEIIDLIEVIEDEIAAGSDAAESPAEPSEPDMGEPVLLETLESGDAFPRETGQSNAPKILSPAPTGQPLAVEPRRAVPPRGPTPSSTNQAADKPVERAGGLRGLDTEQLMAEFPASGDPGLSQRTGEQDSSADESEKAPPRTVEEDLFSELLEDLESTERAVAQEAAAVQPSPSGTGAAAEPELRDVDWVRSGKYYPQLIASLDNRIAECQQEMEKKIGELKIQRDQLRQNFEDVRGLLYAREDELRKAIIRVFTTFWRLKVSELDATKKESYREDLLVEHDGRKIVFKIKSTISARPSVKFITQLWQELHYSGMGAHTEGGLILNHDVGVEPKSRGLAYTGDEEEYLEDIIFVDTRVLYNLTLAIIDYGLPVQEATELLLRKGRVKFQLDDVAT